MNYQKWILQRLLRIYEKSKQFREGSKSGGRRIMFHAQQETELDRRMESPDEKALFFDALEQLEDAGLISYTWMKYEKGNLVDRVILNTDPESLAESYRRIGEVPKKVQVEKLLKAMEQTLNQIAISEADTDIQNYLRQTLEKIKEKQDFYRPFSDNTSMNQDILKFLTAIARNREEQQERLLSTQLYGDSKYFERAVKSKILIILRQIARERGNGEFTDEELLQERGIVRWPEILEFRGHLLAVTDKGGRIDYRPEIYGAYINAETVRHTDIIELPGVRRILFIENKANYTWYVGNHEDPSELVILHGGVYSPAKGMFFRKIADAASAENIKKSQDFQSKKDRTAAAEQAPILIQHWSDIDVGGFRIFCRLRDTLFPQLLPFQMDIETLHKYRNKALKIEQNSYLKLLETMRQDPAYAVFHKVIAYMMEHHCRLEQENEI